MLNLSPEAYQPHRLREVAFRPNYHPHLVAQKIRAAGLRWLHLTIQMAKQVAEAAVLVEHYYIMILLLFKANNWVMSLGHHLATLKEAVVVLVEAYASAEVGA